MWYDLDEGQQALFAGDLAKAVAREMLMQGHLCFVSKGETDPPMGVAAYSDPPKVYVWHCSPRSRPELSSWKACLADFTRAHPGSFDSAGEAQKAAMQLLPPEARQ